MRKENRRNKSKILEYPPSLSPELDRHFIRGYFDGDGCVSIAKSIQFSVVGTESFLTKVQTLFVKDAGVRLTKLHKDKRNPNHTTNAIVYGGRNNLSKLYKYMYSGSSISLRRKHDKFKLI